MSTGLGAAWNTCNIEKGTTVAVFGLGAVGLAIVQGAKARQAKRIIAVDINPAKFEIASRLGATDCVNSLQLPEGTSIQSHIVSLTGWGVDYSFDATGNVTVMRAALECAHRGDCSVYLILLFNRSIYIVASILSHSIVMNVKVGANLA